MYKLLAIDLDGTLLDSYGEIKKEDKDSIQLAIQKGVEVVLATGRAPFVTKEFCDQLNLKHYYISGNGALLYDMQKQESIYENYMDKEKVLEIIKECEKNSIYYNIYTDKSIITKRLRYNVLYYHYENNKKSESKKSEINIVEDVYQYIINSQNTHIVKITLCDDNEIVFKNILKKVRNIKNISILDVAHMSRKVIKSGTEEVPIEYYYTEISSQNVNKWNAIQMLINQLGIDKQEVITIGDNVNDIEMIQGAGMGIVVENGAPYIKQKADYVTGNNNENGVSKAIKKFILN